MLTPIELVCSRLEDVKRSVGGYMARCPGHDDDRRSLSVRERADGTVLVHCFAGCATPHVLRAVGLRMSDLFPRTRSGGAGGAG